MRELCYNELPLKIKQVLYDASRKKVFEIRKIKIDNIKDNYLTINNYYTNYIGNILNNITIYGPHQKYILTRKVAIEDWLNIFDIYSLSMSREIAELEIMPIIFGQND